MSYPYPPVYKNLSDFIKHRKTYITKNEDKEEKELLWKRLNRLRKNLEHNENKIKEVVDKLVEVYLPHAVYIAKSTAMKLPTYVDINDIISDGIFGLYTAIIRFDETKRVTFESYSSNRIKGSILDEIRSKDNVPRFVRNRQEIVNKVKDYFLVNLGIEATPEEISDYIASEIDIEEKVEYIIKDGYNVSKTFSINNEISPNQGQSFDPYYKESDMFSEWIQEKRTTIEDIDAAIDNEYIRRKISENLSEYEKTVLDMYYYENKTNEEIATFLGVSDHTVINYKNKLIEKINKVIYDNEFASVLF